jgi:hypothetical protein
MPAVGGVVFRIGQQDGGSYLVVRRQRGHAGSKERGQQ